LRRLIMRSGFIVRLRPLPRHWPGLRASLQTSVARRQV
jgi:hypothetical protein